MIRTPFVPAELLSKLWRAVIEFDMLQAGDRILIGLSGGKDSMFLTAALAEIQKYAPVPFELACYTVDAMFSSCFSQSRAGSFLRILWSETLQRKGRCQLCLAE